MKIDKSRKDAKCRMCYGKDETIHHIVGGCSNFAQKAMVKAFHRDILSQRKDLKSATSGTT